MGTCVGSHVIFGVGACEGTSVTADDGVVVAVRSKATSMQRMLTGVSLKHSQLEARHSGEKVRKENG